MAKFVTIGERLSTTAPAVNKAFMERYGTGKWSDPGG